MTLLSKLLIASGVAIVTLLLTTKVAAQERPATTLRKPEMKDTIRATIYADNSFQLYLNGELVAVDSIRFIPHNVIEVDVLPAYPLTIAVIAEERRPEPDGSLQILLNVYSNRETVLRQTIAERHADGCLNASDVALHQPEPRYSNW